jgi:hypothetical protein
VVGDFRYTKTREALGFLFYWRTIMVGGFNIQTEDKAGFNQPFVKPEVSAQSPTLGVLNAPTETVQGQVNNIMTAGNPLLERAKTNAAQAANQRGLLNTSMGIQAGQEAMLSAALPMAQADAASYRNQGLVNQQYTNQFADQDNSFAFNSALSGQDYGQKMGLSDQDNTQMQDSVAKEYGYKTNLQNVQDVAQMDRANVVAQTARLGTEAGLSKEVMDSLAGLETSYMKDWVEINKMVFDPEDVSNDTLLRTDAMNKLKTEYDGRKVIVNDIQTTAKSWDWGIV